VAEPGRDLRRVRSRLDGTDLVEAASGEGWLWSYAPRESGLAPCLSIVTPFFDTDPPVFEETVRSIMSQSLQQWEWVIVDDGSTREDCRELLADLARRDLRVRVVRHERNRGVPAARNTGIAKARCDFVLQVDSDDLIEPTAAEKWLWFLASHPECAFVNSFHVAFGEREYLWPRGFHDGDAFLKENRANPVGIARKETFAAVGGFDETLTEGLEDWEFWLRCAAAGLWGATVPEYLHWYRRKGEESERWPNWDEGKRQKELLRQWRARYPGLNRKSFPRIERTRTPEAEIELAALPFHNALAKQRRRLLLIVPWLTTGGADTFNLDLVEQLTQRGWEITIVTTLQGDNAWASRFTRHTPDVFILQNLLKPADYPRFFRYIVGSRQPDAVLVSNSVFAYRALPYLRGLADGVPIVDYCHSIAETWLGGGYPRLSVDSRDALDLHVVSSEFLMGWMVHRGVDPARVTYCYTNVDTDELGPSRRDALDGLALPEELPVILYACRVDVEKQPAVFAKTMLELRRRGYRFTALVVGDGPYLRWLKRFSTRHRLQECVHFLGRQPNAYVRRLMAGSDCVFLPSQFEGISLTLFEAMAEGVAVVGADVGGQRELVTPDCGILVQRGNEETEVRRYADALAGLLDDPERRRAMGEAGRRRSREHFRLEAMGDRMDSLLQHARELARTSPRATPTPEQARSAALRAILELSWTFQAIPGLSAERLSVRLRLRLFRLAAHVGMPLHRLALRLGLHWIEGLRQRVSSLLQPKTS
jgi:glycosyltransferase involved in cell wall biosynthesis